ncbi:MAG: 2-oxoglutarate dehydrogenase E1 component [Bernardetiaceae bacterium]|nr:2-oxoglutarate dehydrogenase E1 component [Bernardetiaceae bacterium]
MDKYSYISNAHSAYIDQLYQDYKQNPESVDASWQKFFEGFDFSLLKFDESAKTNGSVATAQGSIGEEELRKELSVKKLIDSYRLRGHLQAKTNPVRERIDRQARLEIEHFGLTEDDLKQTFRAGNEIKIGPATLEKIIQRLKELYEGSIGFEYMSIRDPEIKYWFRSQVEKGYPEFNLSLEEKKHILSKLNEAVVFESFLHKKYIGQKRFSLEGGESTIPALDEVINRAAELGVEEVVIGMAHRGRLNVLVNILGKTYAHVFNEFEGNSVPDAAMGDGDVKYHLGYSAQIETRSGKKIDLKLAPNPSHLEAVDPVVQGFARAKIDHTYDNDDSKVLPILIHGDAAIAGQGIVYEITQMSRLKGYNVGGTLHFIINNQVGFTTDFGDARSSTYCTDISQLIEVPEIHVNGDDPEAVIFSVRLATEFRQKFKRDVFVDMVCYRKHGHNEADEPKFTQPKLYNIISKHPDPRKVYMKKLEAQGSIDAKLAKSMEKEFSKLLQSRLDEVRQNPLSYEYQALEMDWKSLRRATPEDFETSPDTSISEEVIEKVAQALITLPEGFTPLRQISKLIEDRKTQFQEEKVLNWANAELLAYGSLLLEGKTVRMSGQDVERGTFSHRHAALKDAETNEVYNNLNNLDTEAQGRFMIYNSLLSEYGVLGFEFGYAMANPSALVIWEAQFGDFANGAQVMIDQFITSTESKWQRMNGLVMLLPHGYEGQGPEHSSARLERFLQLAAEYNIVVTNLTTPANLFHMLRRQLAWEFRKPCVLMSPKSLLRHPKVISPIEDFTKGKFQEVIGDDYAKPYKNVKKILLCSGKVYIDLLEKQQEDKRKDVAVIRIEQIAPFPMKQVEALIAKYPDDAKIYWVQEEPSNMGAWAFILRSFYKHKSIVIEDVLSRKASASPATGFMKVHKQEQEKLVNWAFEI